MKRGKPLQRKSRLRPRAVREAFIREEDTLANASPRMPYGGRDGGPPVTPLPPNVRRIALGMGRSPVSPASSLQRAKAKAGCRVTGVEHADPAHVVDRSLGGCDDPLCTVPLARLVHDAYDRGEVDLLPYLTREEQAHAVGHLGLLRALRRITGVDWKEARDASL